MSDLGLAKTSLPHNTGSHETWSVVEEWVQRCSTQHPCLDRTDAHWYPTRLVERISDEMFRVVRSDSGSFCRGRRYITLSHKWGTGEFLQLSASNLAVLEEGLPIKRLRKTFQDTLTVAHRLDIPYVWIDSLCIIQSGDDHEDWRRESQTMTDVYSNSFCNISADYGDEENGLFFQRQDDYLQPPYKLQLRWKTQLRKSWKETWKQLWKKRSKRTSREATRSSSGVQISPPKMETCYIVRQTGWREMWQVSPLNRRGWVMQERLLAPRVLSFTARQVSWKCGQTVTTELWPRRVFNTPSLQRLENYLGAWDVHLETTSNSQRHWSELDAGPLASWWYWLVQDYTRCELTNESDRLVAIAGMARKVRPIVRDQYVTGLWAGSLPWALAWGSFLHERRQSVACHAPTFSWAACPGPVIFSYGSLPPPDEATLLLAAAFIKYRSDRPPRTAVRWPDDELLRDDVFGPLRSPEVEVQARGILRSCRLGTEKPRPGSFFSDRAYPSTSVEACWTRPEAPENSSGIDVTMDDVLNADDKSRTIFYYAVILLDKKFGGVGKCAAVGLLLESVGAGKGRFKRVGYIRQHDQPVDEPELLHPLGNERSIPAWSFDEATGEHTFYIV